MLKKLKTTLAIAAVALSTAAFNVHAVDVELALVIDASGSISPSNYTLQKQGYINALTALLPADGSVAIGVWEFGRNVVQVVASTVINDAADKTALLNAIGAMNRVGVNTGSTAIGDAINVATAALTGNGIDPTDKTIIDVSTDGSNNYGANPYTASAAAVAGEIDQVNGLGIGTGTAPGWNAGTDSFSLLAPTYADFEDAVTEKLKIEIQGVPDGGSTLAMLGLACLGLTALRRRQK